MQALTARRKAKFLHERLGIKSVVRLFGRDSGFQFYGDSMAIRDAYAAIREARAEVAYSDESGHLFRFVSDTDPTISDSGRSEATLGREQ